MKRSPLKRKTGLTRKRPLSSPPSVGTVAPGREARKSPPSPPKPARRPMQRPMEPGEAEWKKPRRGICALCKQRGRIVLHHIVPERKVREAGGWPWDPRNALQVCAPYAMGGRNESQCHDGHHHPGVNDTRIPLAKVPKAAREFAVEVLGEGPAYEYFRRRYR